MQAIFFPSTYISETACEAVKTCFQRIRLYQPTRRQVPSRLQELSHKGLVDIVIPVEGEDKKIEILVRDYHAWADLNQGGVLAYLKRQSGSIPFFDDTAIAQIRADIRHGARTPEIHDSVFNARVFLQIAQEYDLQSEEVARKFASMKQAEKDLFKTITGESEVQLQNALQPQTEEGIASAGYLILPRIHAWAQLFLQDSAFDPTGSPTAFVTIHREAIEFLADQTPSAEQILKVTSLPVINHLSEGYDDWRSRFSNILDSFPENASAMAADLIARFQISNPSSMTANLTLYRFPGESPAVFFARCIGRPLSETQKKMSESRDQTLIGLVEMN